MIHRSPNVPGKTVGALEGPTDPGLGNLQRLAHRVALGLLVGVCAWSVFARAHLDFNGPHMDELDYLYVGERLLQGETWPTQTYIFSSDLPLWILAAGDRFAGGYLGARGLAGLLGALSLIFVGRAVSRSLADPVAAFWALLLLAVSASHLFISRLATYDIIAFVLLAAALDALSFARKRRSPKGALLASLLMAAATLAKYPAGALWPVGFLAFVRRPRLLAAYTVPFGALLTLYAVLEKQELTVLVERQLLGTHGPNASYAAVATAAAGYLWPLALAALAGFAVARGKVRSVILVASLGAWPLVVYHLQGRNLISLYKHLVFSVLFLAPAASVAFARLSRAGARGRLAAAALVAAFASANAAEVRRMEQSFPDVRAMAEVLRRHVDAETRILSEDPYLPRYLFADVVAAEQISETTWYDHDGDGRYSAADVAAALAAGGFDVVVLTGVTSPELHDLLATGLLEARYRKVFSEAFATSSVMGRRRFGHLEIHVLQGRLRYGDQACRNNGQGVRSWM
ncbi:MAG: phospholipid carrier-dependent glycosyltransferase [Acidobacteriota bacterium]